LEALAALVATEWVREVPHWPQSEVVAIEGGVDGLDMD
jgi:hypothetical protein